MIKYNCKNCGNVTTAPQMRGSDSIEIVLYIFLAIIGGVIYSIWRRMVPNNVCPICKTESLVPISSALGQTVSCEWCAEPIQPNAKICKHCKKEVTPQIALSNDPELVSHQLQMTNKPNKIRGFHVFLFFVVAFFLMLMYESQK